MSDVADMSLQKGKRPSQVDKPPGSVAHVPAARRKFDQKRLTPPRRGWPPEKISENGDALEYLSCYLRYASCYITTYNNI